MTTDAASAAPTETRPPKALLWRLALALPLVLTGWLGTLWAVGLWSDAAPAQYVFLPPPNLLAALPELQLLDAGRGWIVVASDQPGLVRRLQGAGAALVLPAGLKGCTRA